MADNRPTTIDPRIDRIHRMLIIALIFTPAFVGLAWIVESMSVVTLDLILGLIYAGILLLLRSTRSAWWAGNALCLAMTVHLSVAAYLIGGAVPVCVLLVPFVATLAIDARYGWGWLAVQGVALGALSAITGAPEGLLSPPSVVLLMMVGALSMNSIQVYVDQSERAGQERDALVDRLEELVLDRTAELRLEVDKRRRAQEEATTANLAKSRFLYNMSHELRTPLNAIVGYTELVRDEIEDEELSDDLGRVLRSAHHLTGLLGDMLDLSRIETGEIDLQLHSVSLGPLVSQIEEMTAPLADERANLVSVEAKADVQVWADEHHLRRVLLALLSNAHKFCEGCQITLRMASNAHTGWVEVEDDGPGIAEEDQTRIFERFTQLDDSSTKRIGGAGLGLAISRALIRRMGGQLSLRSVLGQGSCFRIELPVEPRSPRPAEFAYRSI